MGELFQLFNFDINDN